MGTVLGTSCYKPIGISPFTSPPVLPACLTPPVLLHVLLATGVESNGAGKTALMMSAIQVCISTHSSLPASCRRGIQRRGQDGADDGAPVGVHWRRGLSCRGAPSALVALCCWVDRKGTVGAPVGAHWLCRLSHRGAPAAAADNTALNIPNPTWSSSTQGAGAARPVLADIIYDGAKRARVRVEGKVNGAPFWVERTANKK